MNKYCLLLAFFALSPFTTYGQSDKWTRSESGNEFTYSNGTVSFKMINIAGGSFQMGATEEQGMDARPDERPVHSVSIKNFAMGETEVTCDLWEAVMGEKRGAPGQAVDGLTMEECAAFLSKLSSLTGEEFRLPTEAEWEYAARGGSSSKHFKFSGSNDLSSISSRNPDKTVKMSAPNELGLYDMTGNVPEICSDWYSQYYYSTPGPWDNPAGPKNGTQKVVRGGGWNSTDDDCRVSRRSPLDERGTGLRLAKLERRSVVRHGKWERRIEGDDLVFTDGEVVFKMKRIEGGSFMMGKSTDPKLLPDEMNAHKVTLSSYYIGETEVTRELWSTFMGDTYGGLVTQKYAGDLRCPVENVTYESICVFINRLSNATGVPFRLPTEAEWEFAAKGGNKSAGYVYSGTNKFHSHSKTGPIPVYKCVSNELGLYGMSENVKEMCSDYLGPYEKEDQVDPTGPASGTSRVVRGGFYYDTVFEKEKQLPTIRKGFSKVGVGLRLGLSISDLD